MTNEPENRPDNRPLCEVRTFIERDIDLWLAEELRVNATFAKWFALRANMAAGIQAPPKRVRVSVMTEAGETDVEALFDTSAGTQAALLVENKIEHSLSADQLQRYERRGQYGITYKHWNQFHVVVFAPSLKLTKYAALLERIPHISFEEAAEFLRSTSTDARTLYRSEFLDRAAQEQTLDVDGADAFRVAFWKSVYAMIDDRYSDFFALEPNVFPKSTYITANPNDAPGYFRVDLKGHMGEVDLAFKNINPGTLVTFLEASKPSSAKVVFNKRSIALQIANLPKFYVGDGIEAISSKAVQSFDAAHTLLTFWRENRAFFDEHYGLRAAESKSSATKPVASPKNVALADTQRMRDPESLYSLTLPPSAIKTDKYIIVNGYGTPPKDRWFDLRKLTSFTYDEKSRAWTIVAPKQQLEARGVLDDAKSLTRAGSQ